MCVHFSEEWNKTDRDIIAWKVVRGTKKSDQFISPLLVGYRDVQDGFDSCGTVKTYTLGKTSKSKRPGIYLFQTRQGARHMKTERSAYKILKVLIPAGTLVRRSTAFDSWNPGRINALQIIPLSIAR